MDAKINKKKNMHILWVAWRRQLQFEFHKIYFGAKMPNSPQVPGHFKIDFANIFCSILSTSIKSLSILK